MSSEQERASAWSLMPGRIFLNHGSFGACPVAVQRRQRALREELEREPVQFMLEAFHPLLDASRARLAMFLGADAQDVVFVPNATTGVNAVLRSMCLERGDEIVITDHGYNACNNAARFVAERSGARVVVAPVPFPIHDADEVVAAIQGALSPRTRLVLVDHVTSPTGLIFPVEAIARVCQARGVDVLVDGAHAPGMLPVDLRALQDAGVSFYTGNCHKWICAPKGSAFLFVQRDRQAEVRPTVISHGANRPHPGRPAFWSAFDWTGTHDPSAAMCVGEALDVMAGMVEGGWPAVMAHNRALALEARDLLCDTFGCAPPAPDAMIGALAAVPLPDDTGAPSTHPLYLTDCQLDLLRLHNIQVPIVPWPAHPRRLVRVSAQLYNQRGEYETLARVLPSLL